METLRSASQGLQEPLKAEDKVGQVDRAGQARGWNKKKVCACSRNHGRAMTAAARQRLTPQVKEEAVRYPSPRAAQVAVLPETKINFQRGEE